MGKINNSKIKVETDLRITEKELSRLIKQYNNYKKKCGNRYHISNKLLYDLCKKYKKHSNPYEIEAKIYLIGRAYAAAVERRQTSNAKKRKGDFIYDNVMKSFIKNNRPTNFSLLLDKFIDEYNNKKDSFSKETLCDVLKIHKKLVNLFKYYTENEKRSLSSKYLHFHCPNICFMFDSRANSAITKLVKKQEKIVCDNSDEITNKKVFDEEYYNFIARLSILSKYLKTNNPRNIDNFLLWYADNKIKK